MPKAAAARHPLHRHLTILGRRDPHIRRAIKEVGLPGPRRIEPGFAALVRIIVDQQVSTASGAAIWARLAHACDGAVTPARILAHGEMGLRGCGLSGPKARYVLGVAEAVANNHLDLDALDAADDDAVRATLTALKGIGNWTADIYLMFAMGRTDVWPVADLALQHGVRLLHGRRKKPTVKVMATVGELWRPYRSGAAILLWHYYGSARKKLVKRPNRRG